MTKAVRSIDQIQFYKICQWMSSLPQPITLTKSQVLQQASKLVNVAVSESSLKRALSVTGVALKDPRVPNFKGKDRTVRLATVVRQLLTQLEHQIGFIPDSDTVLLLQELLDRKGTTDPSL